MRLIHTDWSSDFALFFIGVFVVTLVLAMALDRASPKGKKRKVRRAVTERPGDIID